MKQLLSVGSVTIFSWAIKKINWHFSKDNEEQVFKGVVKDLHKQIKKAKNNPKLRKILQRRLEEIELAKTNKKIQTLYKVMEQLPSSKLSPEDSINSTQIPKTENITTTE